MTTIERIRLIPREDEFPTKHLPSLEAEAARSKMRRALGARKLRQAAERAFHWWPSLEETAIALCLHLGDLRDDTDDSLAHTAVAKAVRAFSDAADDEKPIAEAARAFLVEIVRVAETLQCTHVYVETPDAKVVWRQFAESYSDWCRSAARLGEVRRSKVPLLIPVHPWAAQRMLATQTMGPHDFVLLFKERGN